MRVRGETGLEKGGPGTKGPQSTERLLIQLEHESVAW